MFPAAINLFGFATTCPILDSARGAIGPDRIEEPT
jgi:hypothetical protein